jgi:hypothetical protein
MVYAWYVTKHATVVTFNKKIGRFCSYFIKSEGVLPYAALKHLIK